MKVVATSSKGIVMRSFGDILKAQRQRLNLTQKQVAGYVGVSDAYICYLEQDKKCPPPYHTVALIANVLKLDADQLWKVAVKYREKEALEKSRNKSEARRRYIRSEASENSDQDDNGPEVPDSQINAFFELREIQMTTFGLFQKQPKDLTMEEKRVLYYALTKAQSFISGS